MPKINYYFKIVLLIAVFIMGYSNLSAQVKVPRTQVDPASQGLIVLDNGKTYSPKNSEQVISDVLKPSRAITFSSFKSEKDNFGYTHEKFQEYYNTIKVEYGTLILHSQANKVQTITSEYYPIPNGFNTVSALNNEKAFDYALATVGADHYMWEYPEMAEKMDDYKKPIGELVILPDFWVAGEIKNITSYKLAYKFDIYATQPISRGFLYIDANNGEALLYDAIIKHATNSGFAGTPKLGPETEADFCDRQEGKEYNFLATGTAATRYSGTRNITTRIVSGGVYSLRDNTRGNGINTYNSGRQPAYPTTNFNDADNNWTAGEFNNANKDNAALDAHWGAEMTYDYWSIKHSRNSFDNAGAAINSYVHYDDVVGNPGYNNAFWNGSVMTYGDGSCGATEGCNGFDALTSIDVAGHEIGHAVCTYTANLVYQRESGAMNEGFSDIWGAAIEHFAKGTGTDANPDSKVWLIGDEIDRRTGSAALRSMSNPNLLGQPDTYLGTYWRDATASCIPNPNTNDNCGVHTNSGVLNFWFYLSVVGGSGTNDIGSNYSVSGIGMNKASAIAFRTETYLSQNATYSNARTMAIQAATDIYGACSSEVQTVTNAWYAVGVGAAYVNSCTPSIGFVNPTGNVLEGTDCNYIDVNVPLTIGAAPSSNAIVTFTVTGGTANNGLDYTIQTPTVTFPTGSTANRNMILRIYNDGFVEPNETAVISFTVNANGGNATSDPSANTFTFTINNDDIATIATQTVQLFSEDFEVAPYKVGTSSNSTTPWQLSTAAGASSTYWTIANSNASKIAFTNDDACNCDKSNDLIWTNAFSLNGYSSATLKFDHAFANIGAETAKVQVSINGTAGPYIDVANITNTSTSLGGGAYSTPWVNDVTVDLTPYVNNPNVSVRFKYSDGGAWLYGMALDNIRITAVQNTQIQTAVNTATKDDIALSAAGTIYTSDAATGKVMMDITNNNASNYGCVSVKVTRAGIGATSYNGSLAPNLVMSKTFAVSTTNTVASGNTSIKFYFTEAEIAGWEAATGNTRNNLKALRDKLGNTEMTDLTLTAFGSNVSLSGNFTGLDGTFYFGPAEAFQCATITIYTGGSWTNGIPTSSKTVILNDNYNTSAGNIEACKLIIQTGKTLTVSANTYVEVNGDILVSGNLNVMHQGSVVQLNTDALVLNGGNINVEKITPALSPKDFMILSSPMSAETRNGVYGSSIMVRNHITTNFIPNPDVEAGDPGAENFADNNGDNWVNYSGNINVAEGYLVKPQPNSTTGGSFTLNYNQGTLNTGNLNYGVLFNTTQNDSPNVSGNPYPSAINANMLLAANTGTIDAIYFWEHLTAPNNNYPGYKVNNYDMGDLSVYNSLGGVAAANDSGNSTQPNGYIASGQGFAFKAKAAGNLAFNNGMRVTGNNNTYRSIRNMDRIWLKVSNAEYGLGSNMLVAFTDDTSPSYEPQSDVKRLATPISLYSHLVTGEELAIQGRKTFNVKDEVEIGFNSQIEQNATYTISMTNFEGASLEGIQVLLKDNLLQVTTNLSNESYTFLAKNDSYTERFTLFFRIKSNLKNENSSELLNVSLSPNPTTSLITIISPLEIVTSAEIFDIRGRKIKEVSFDGKNVYDIDLSALDNAVYFIRINSNEGSVIKRVIKQK